MTRFAVRLQPQQYFASNECNIIEFGAISHLYKERDLLTATLSGNLLGRAWLRACLAACLAVRFVVATDGNDGRRKMTIIEKFSHRHFS
jgi:hypothetical protein